MRQIKFRGKRKSNGDWVESDSIQNNPFGKTYLMDANRLVECYNKEIMPNGIWIEVIPETVGQFTGLTDKNGKEIYEGDILEYDTGKIYVVVYSIEAFDSGTNEHYIGAYMLRDDHNFHELICNVTRPYKYAEIIGNIHDNPELLTK